LGWILTDQLPDGIPDARAKGVFFVLGRKAHSLPRSFLKKEVVPVKKNKETKKNNKNSKKNKKKNNKNGRNKN
jgi:hypothetical protein